jgi:hypothetical protein
MAGGLPVSPGLRCTQLSPPDLGSWRPEGGSRGTYTDSWRRVVVAAGMAVVVLLGMSAGHILRISPSFAVPGDHPFRAVAWTRPAVPGSDTGVCAAGPSYQRDEDSLQLEQDGTSRASVRGFSVADAGGHSGTPGARGVSGPPQIACGSMAGRPLGPHVIAHTFRLDARPVRRGIRLLAFRRWVAEGPDGRKGAGCVIAWFPRRPLRLGPLLAHLGTRGSHRMWSWGKGSLAGSGRWKPGAISAADPVLACLARSNRLARAPPSGQWYAAYSGAQAGSGDRGSLPGRSTRYRVIWLVCARCGATMTCMFYDDGDAPLCVNPLHGPMEILR